MMIFLSATVLFAISLHWILQEVYAGNTVCTSNHTDWYTSVIGETPCTTYERLRRICNPKYQVGTLTRNTPPDYCDDQVQGCCCNSISFTLSMLCLACQDNTANGFDAGVGAYQQYLKKGMHTCRPRKDQNFTTTIQKAVCNTGIKIEDQLYNLFWVKGDWYYVYTRDAIIRNHAAFSNKTQTRCITTTSSLSGTKTALSTAAPSGTGSGSMGDDSASSGSQLGSGAIAGIVVGAVVIIALLIILILLLRRRRVRAAAAPPKIDPYTSSGPGTVSSKYGPPGPTSTGYPSDGDETTPSAAFAFHKHNRERRQPNSHPSTSNTNTSAPGSGSGYTPQGSSVVVGLDHESGAGPMGRHIDAGPVQGADLSRSASGRLPPAYGEQLTPVRHAIQATGIEAPEMGARNGSDSTLMLEEGDNLQSSASLSVPPRRKE